MRTFVAALAALALIGLVTASTGSSAPPSAAIKEKDAEAARVLAQVNALDTRFGSIVDAWDGAKIQLASTRKQLRENRLELSFAQTQNKVAQRRAAKLLVTIYEGESPDLIQLLAGSTKLSDVINAIQYSRDVASSAERIARAAVQARDKLVAATTRLEKTERTRRATLAQLEGERKTIGALLQKRRTLLASIQTQITQIRAREAAEQARAAAAARVRLAREQALLKRQAADREKAAAAAAAAAKPAVPAATTTAAAPTAPAPTAAGTTTTAPTTSTSTTTAAPTPAPATGGHPEAASIALQYLGTQYQWGGASPSTGFDCSGLVMYVFAQLGVQLPHFAAGQYGYGTPVARSQLQPGDLVFFDGLSHVGIYIGGGQLVHAPHTGDVVRIAPLSDFAGRYVGARRV